MRERASVRARVRTGGMSMTRLSVLLLGSSQTPENPGYASSQHYLDDLQRKSVEGQIAYEKRKAIQRRLRMKKVSFISRRRTC